MTKTAPGYATIVVGGNSAGAVQKAQKNAQTGLMTQVIGFKWELNAVRELARDVQLRIEPISNNGLLLWKEAN